MMGQSVPFPHVADRGIDLHPQREQHQGRRGGVEEACGDGAVIGAQIVIDRVSDVVKADRQQCSNFFDLDKHTWTVMSRMKVVPS